MLIDDLTDAAHRTSPGIPHLARWLAHHRGAPRLRPVEFAIAQRTLHVPDYEALSSACRPILLLTPRCHPSHVRRSADDEKVGTVGLVRISLGHPLHANRAPWRRWVGRAIRHQHRPDSAAAEDRRIVGVSYITRN